MPNGIDLILADHQKVNDLFDLFEQTLDGAIVGQVVDALSAHDDAEQAALYPLSGIVLGDVDQIMRASVAHSMVKKQIDLLTGLEGVPLVEAFRGLRAIVQEHVDDEEKNLLPELSARCNPQQLEGLGARILQAKQRGG